ncbi:MAG TPA: hypothetical protein DCW46_00290 [Desulfotomaculum sp.]|nr:hypothetical protein [Desulfotomaculum sp.]
MSLFLALEILSVNLDSTFIGAGGTNNWEFKAISDCTTKLSLKYSRPWE